MSLAKPQMRNFISSKFKRDVVITFILCGITCTAHRLLIVNPAKQRYADFYKTYDPYAEFEKMRAAGIFTSCPPDE